MKTRLLLAGVIVAGLAACGRPNDVSVAFPGQSPVYTKAGDTRGVTFHCPNCGVQVELDTLRCPNKRCGATISWAREDRVCAYCEGTGKCATCRMMNQVNGECYNCRPGGPMTRLGVQMVCPNCGGSKKCAACGKTANPGQCDFCGGTGKVSLKTVKIQPKPAEKSVE
ncbi:MAG: hypothetical protein HYY16_06695 [Planctomycetes bacterium]|nr:hypothetical protein [Planctomycetota bacterium]